MSKLSRRPAAALFVALAAPAAAEIDQSDIHTEDYTASAGAVTTLFVAGIGMVDAGPRSAAIAEARED